MCGQVEILLCRDARVRQRRQATQADIFLYGRNDAGAHVADESCVQ